MIISKKNKINPNLSTLPPNSHVTMNTDLVLLGLTLIPMCTHISLGLFHLKTPGGGGPDVFLKTRGGGVQPKFDTGGVSGKIIYIYIVDV